MPRSSGNNVHVILWYTRKRTQELLEMNISEAHAAIRRDTTALKLDNPPRDTLTISTVEGVRFFWTTRSFHSPVRDAVRRVVDGQKSNVDTVIALDHLQIEQIRTADSEPTLSDMQRLNEKRPKRRAPSPGPSFQRNSAYDWKRDSPPNHRDGHYLPALRRMSLSPISITRVNKSLRPTWEPASSQSVPAYSPLEPRLFLPAVQPKCQPEAFLFRPAHSAMTLDPRKRLAAVFNNTNTFPTLELQAPTPLLLPSTQSPEFLFYSNSSTSNNVEHRVLNAITDSNDPLQDTIMAKDQLEISRLTQDLFDTRARIANLNTRASEIYKLFESEDILSDEMLEIVSVEDDSDNMKDILALASRVRVERRLRIEADKTLQDVRREIGNPSVVLRLQEVLHELVDLNY